MQHEPRTSPKLGLTGALGPLRHRPFLIFWFGACISNTGNWTENAAQSWAVTSQTIGNPHRGRVLSVMLLAQQGGMPLGHLFAGFLTHYMSPAWVLRLMLGTLLVVMVVC